MAVDRKKAAAARARKKAQENQAKSSGGRHLNFAGEIFDAKAANGKSILMSVIPYTVKEKRHPDEITPGEIWYKRPYKIHRIPTGDGDRTTTVVCPKTMNTKSPCPICEHITELRKDWETNETAIRDYSAKNRDLYLFYTHDEKKIVLLDEAHGSTRNLGFGALLDARITNPRAEEWAAFWLDGDDGMALDVFWKGDDSGGGMVWYKPVSIDFVDRKKAPVPKDIWKQCVELSELLIVKSYKELEAMYFGIPDDEPEIQTDPKEDEPATCSTEEESSDEEESFDEDNMPDFEGMNKRDLMTFASKELGMESKAIRALSSLKEDQMRKKVEELWEAQQLEDLPSDGQDEAEGTCPFKHIFGKEFGEHKDCAEKCPDESYQACMEGSK